MEYIILASGLFLITATALVMKAKNEKLARARAEKKS
jgi:hypothetical protein